MEANVVSPLSPRSHRIAVAVFFFTAGFTFASWASRIPQIQAKLQLNEAQLGSVLLALPFGLLVSSLISGAMVTKFGSRNVLRIAAFAYPTILLSIGFTEEIWQLVVALFFFGLSGNMMNVSVNTQAVAVEKLYGRTIMASFHGIWSLAGFSGAAVGALLMGLQLLTWQHFAIIAATVYTLTFIFLSRTIPTTAAKKSQSAFALPNKQILKLGAIAFACLLCEGTMFDWSGVYFKKAVQVPASLTGLGYAAFMGCMATGRFMADKVVMRVGSRLMLRGAGFLIATGLMTAVLFPTIVAATIGFMLVGFGVSSVVPLVYSQAGRSTTLQPGQALAMVSTFGYAGFLSGPPIIGFVAEATNLRWSFAMVALVGLSTSILAGALPKKK